jgi:hypothetical protein
MLATSVENILNAHFPHLLTKAGGERKTHSWMIHSIVFYLGFRLKFKVHFALVINNNIYVKYFKIYVQKRFTHRFSFVCLGYLEWQIVRADQ